MLRGALIGILGLVPAATGAHEEVTGWYMMLQDDRHKGYDVTETGLVPVYPEDFRCSVLTSLYASWVDVDGTEREEEHTGVDGGEAGDAILSPAPGEVVRAWVSDWGWGKEGSLLIRHSREDLNLGSDHAPHYYSEFDHLNYKDIKAFQPGERVARGQKLAEVWFPGGNRDYLPEVHWEVWEVPRESLTKWKKNRFGRPRWKNRTARLIDPLYLLSRQVAPTAAGEVMVQPFVSGSDYSKFSGFTYILPCLPTE